METGSKLKEIEIKVKIENTLRREKKERGIRKEWDGEDGGEKEWREVIREKGKSGDRGGGELGVTEGERERRGREKGDRKNEKQGREVGKKSEMGSERG